MSTSGWIQATWTHLSSAPVPFGEQLLYWLLTELKYWSPGRIDWIRD